MLYAGNYVFDFFVRERRSGGKAKPGFEAGIGNSVEVGRCLGKDRLPVHRIPKTSGFDIPAVKEKSQILSTEAALLFVYYYAAEPEVGIGIGRGVVHDMAAGNRVDGFLVDFLDLPSAGYMFVQNQHLAASYAGAYIAEAVVVTDMGVMVVGIRVACLCGIENSFCTAFGAFIILLSKRKPVFTTYRSR